MWDNTKLEACIRDNGIWIAVLCGSGLPVQETADQLFGCGVEAVLNMTDGVILHAYDRKVENSSLSDSLSILCCRLSRRQQEDQE